ncbi:TetR/AcrR family transcriptional regulator [Bacillus chungangensis]|uniref:AcrR family transcriptional regulator n=1 Tax=Bacillus chungangensis TaxID=587633 RepID=A0ABT9WNG5_9BACI|nr:TetR/AcrR family transcriptional regulator [Bacillus chungangensis]MDQ0174820.1 AcrR family transcriptional regulator [Bacillus chungangensis]
MFEQEKKLIDEIARLNEAHLKMTEKQNNIIQAAIEIFSEKGYAASSTSEIAKRAGVAEGTIFRHYKTKKELLVSIVTPTIMKLIAPFILEDVGEVLDKPYNSFREFLYEIMKNRIEFVKKNLPVLKIFVQEIAFHSELQDKYKKYIAEPLFNRIKDIIIYFQEKGEIAELPVYSIIRIVASTVIGFFYMRFLIFPDLEWDDEAEIELTIHFIMSGLSPLKGK